MIMVLAAGMTLFLVALAVSLLASPRTAFACVYIPALLLLATMPMLEIPGIPDARPHMAAAYGLVLGALLLHGPVFRLRLSLLDILIVLLTVSMMITAVTTAEIWTGVSAFGTALVTMLFPYFAARKAFESAETRRQMLWAIVACTFLIFVFALIEARLFPYFYTQVRALFGLGPEELPGTYRRFGFFRARVSFQHPIDLGNSAMLIMGMIAVLAGTCAIRLRKPIIAAALAASGVCILASISFTGYIAAAVGLGLFVTLIAWPWLRRHVLAVILLIIASGFGLTAVLLRYELPPQIAADSSFEGSFNMRARIVQESWNLTTRAGPFGFGKTITKRDIDLESVDNAYLLHAMRNGFVFLILWLLIPVAVGWRAAKAFAIHRDRRIYLPLAAAVASIMGIMVGMYTVWAGAIYATIWFVVLGMTSTMLDLLLAPSTIVAPARTGRRLPAQMARMQT